MGAARTRVAPDLGGEGGGEKRGTSHFPNCRPNELREAALPGDRLKPKSKKGSGFMSKRLLEVNLSSLDSSAQAWWK